MSAYVVYHQGGYDPAAPAQNKAELFDGGTGTYTAWDAAGNQIATRPLSTAEASDLAAQDAARAAGDNSATLRQQAVQALATNRTYVALTSPTATQTTAQMKALSRQMNALIRLTLGLLDGTD